MMHVPLNYIQFSDNVISNHLKLLSVLYNMVQDSSFDGSCDYLAKHWSFRS